MSRSLLVRAAMVGSVWMCAGVLFATQQRGTSPDEFAQAPVKQFQRTQAWFALVRTHKIGEWDQAAQTVSSMDPLTLSGIRDDLRMIRNLLDVAVTRRLTSVELHGRTLNLRSLAPLMGLTTEELDSLMDITRLGDPQNQARQAISRITIRAAMLHTRVAMQRVEDTPPDDRAVPIGAGSAQVIVPGQSAVRVRDGEVMRIADRSIHWAIAREALDIVGPPAAASPVVHAWYETTLAYLQSERAYNALLPHLERARALFPRDAGVWLFSGAASENLALPRVQVAALDASSGVGKPGDLLRQAERDFRRALELNPTLPLVNLRLGRVLTLLARHDQAIDLLSSVDGATADTSVQYLAALFRGRAEESRGQDEAARVAYQHAADLFAEAQSPRLALASIAWRRGDQHDALTQLRVLSNSTTADAPIDPWWPYDVCHVGDVNALFDRLQALVVEALR